MHSSAAVGELPHNVHPDTRRLFETLNGKRYRLHGIAGRLVYRYRIARYPYACHYHELTHEPDAVGKTHPAYQTMRDRLGDDWVSDVGNNPDLLAQVTLDLSVLDGRITEAR